MQACRGRTGVGTLILDHGTRRKLVFNFSLQLFYSLEGTTVLIEGKAVLI
jgi:hypothetical protein